MQGQLTITTHNVTGLSADSMTAKFSDLMSRIFGCWHLEMSRPFSHQGHAYRSCLHCGAQRKFNLGNWEMQGSYYYNRATTSSLKHYTLAAVRKA